MTSTGHFWGLSLWTGDFRFGCNFFVFRAREKLPKGKMWGKKSFFSIIFFISQNFEVWRRYWQKTSFGVPVLDRPYLSSGTCPKSKNRITGVKMAKFFAARQEKLQNGHFRAQKKNRRFSFFSKISPKTQNFWKISKLFTIKIFFAHVSSSLNFSVALNRKKLWPKRKSQNLKFWAQ